VALTAVSKPACGMPPLVALTRITVYTSMLDHAGPVALTRIVAVKRPGSGACDRTSQ